MKQAALLIVLISAFTLLAEDAVAVAEKKYNAAVEQAKKEFIAALKAEQTRLTKAGDLDSALKIRDKVAALEKSDKAEEKSEKKESALDGAYQEWYQGKYTIDVTIEGEKSYCKSKDLLGSVKVEDKKITVDWANGALYEFTLNANGDLVGKSVHDGHKVEFRRVKK